MDPSDADRLPTPVSAWMERWLSKNQIPNSQLRVTLLTGDGSPRQFYRLQFKETSRILLYDAQWKSSENYLPHQRFLNEIGLPVPQFYEADANAGCLLMDDLGDVLLQDHLQKHPEEIQSQLTQALRQLAQLHSNTLTVSNELPASQSALDGDRFETELKHTDLHLVQGLLKLPSQASAALRPFCESLGKLGPLVVCHRDFHSRNLMYHQEQLYWIDFQDARKGAPHYDLASLLYDAYLPLDSQMQTLLISTYQNALLGSQLFQKIDWTRFEIDLKRMAFQRTLKAAGSFASFYTVQKKKTHLPYLKPVLESALAITQEVNVLTDEEKALFPLEQWLSELEGKLP